MVVRFSGRHALFEPRAKFIGQHTVGGLEAELLLHLLPSLSALCLGEVGLPHQTEGMLGPEWQKSVFDFYTVDGAKALAGALRDFRGGKLLVNLVYMPIKCPVAPLEFAFLADWYFTKNGLRDSVEIEFATPLSGPFTRPRCSEALEVVASKRLPDGRGTPTDPAASTSTSPFC